MNMDTKQKQNKDNNLTFIDTHFISYLHSHCPRIEYSVNGEYFYLFPHFYTCQNTNNTKTPNTNRRNKNNNIQKTVSKKKKKGTNI